MSTAEVAKGVKAGATRSGEIEEVALSTVKAFLGSGNPHKHYAKTTPIFEGGIRVPPPEMSTVKGVSEGL